VLGFLYPDHLQLIYLDCTDPEISIQHAFHVVAFQRNIKVADIPTDVLSTRGILVLLILDELEKLYQQQDKARAIKVLTDLDKLAQQSSGWAVLVCGSSGALPRLIAKNKGVTFSLTSKYPILSDAPDLNDHKFRLTRLDSTSE